VGGCFLVECTNKAELGRIVRTSAVGGTGGEPLERRVVLLNRNECLRAQLRDSMVKEIPITQFFIRRRGGGKTGG